MVPQPADDDPSQERLSEIDIVLDAFADFGILLLDSEGRILRWNVGNQLFTGYTSDQVLGQPVSTLFIGEDAEVDVTAKLTAARESGRAEFEGWWSGKDGQPLRVRAVFKSTPAQTGSVAGFVAVVRDLRTGQAHAHNSFHHLLNSAPDAMFIADGDGRITAANTQAELMFGYPREELIGREVETLLPARFRTGHLRYRTGFFEAPAARRMGTGRELAGLHRDGREFPVEVSLSPLQIDGATSVVAAIRDVTERREYEQRLRRQHEEIMELSTPVIQVWDKVLTLPLIGTLDSMRAARLTEGLLTRIGETEAEVVIFDISGVPTIDTQVAQHLLRTVQAAALMGTVSIMCGVRPETAQAMVHLGIDIGQLMARGTLQDALQLALTLLADRAATARDVGEALGSTGQIR